jgi:uncharacterized damage-inducible protein DinB
MNTLAMLRRTYRYNGWANQRAIESIKQMSPHSQKALKALSHLVLAEQAWLSRITTPTDSTGANYWQELNLEDCLQVNAENQQTFQSLLEEADEDSLDKIIVYKNSKGAEFHTPVRDILQHVSMHSMYHRGQIAAAVKAEGGAPLYTDFIFYLREAE